MSIVVQHTQVLLRFRSILIRAFLPLSFTPSGSGQTIRLGASIVDGVASFTVSKGTSVLFETSEQGSLLKPPAGVTTSPTVMMELFPMLKYFQLQMEEQEEALFLLQILFSVVMVLDILLSQREMVSRFPPEQFQQQSRQQHSIISPQL